MKEYWGALDINVLFFQKSLVRPMATSMLNAEILIQRFSNEI